MPRGVAIAIAIGTLAACASMTDGAPMQPSVPVVVDVAATPCDRPIPRRGVGTVIGPNTVLTASHVVEGRLRRLEVDGLAGVVVSSDPRVDLAVLRVDGLDHKGPAPTWDDAQEWHGDVAVVGPSGARPVGVDRTVQLTVVDHTDGTEFVRRSHVLDRAVPEGTSGSPVIADAAVLGVVTLAVRGAGESHVVAADEVEAFLARVATETTVPARVIGEGC